MEIGFCCRLGRGKAVIELLGCKREQRARMLHVREGSQCITVLLGRLYYRARRLNALRSGLEHFRLAECCDNDAALAARTYLRYGLNGLAQLEGDFSLLIWDMKRAQIVAARDPMGGYPLFWTRDSNVAAVSTSLPHLARLTGISTIDQRYVAQFLMIPGQVQELPTDRTVYEGIQRVLPGTWLRIDAKEGQATTGRYWDWMARMTDPGSNSFAKISDGYGSLLRDAVRERIGERTAAHLSGGMDSTSVALLARGFLAERNPGECLHGITLVYGRLSGLQIERTYIDAAYRMHGDILRHEIPADHLVDFDSFTAPLPHPEPYAGLRRMTLDAATVEAAGACGATTLLTGIGGDEMLATAPYHIADILQRGEMLQAWREVRRWAEADNISPWSLVKTYTLPALLPAWSHAGVRALFHNGYETWDGQNDWTIAPWVRRSFAQSQRMQEIGIENARAAWKACHSTPLSIALYLIAGRYGDVDRWSLGVPRGISIAHPFMDPRVFCYGLGMQLRLEPRPGQKPVLAHAMRNVLPGEIIHRQRKVDFSPISYLGLARNLLPLEAIVRESCLHDVLDSDVLLDCLRRAALGGAPGVYGMDRLSLALSLVRWMSLHDRWRREAPLPGRTLILPFASCAQEAC
jgi:asparagine synthase (glutamine-hydrolysing)